VISAVTRALPYTEYSLRRAITAARKAGLRITGIRPDGTLIVREGSESIVDTTQIDEVTAASKWEDIEA
jgi:hypothetical protein